MATELKAKSLYEKLHAIQYSISGLSKDTQGNNYTYVSGEKVLLHIKPLMNEYGLILKQEVLSIVNTRQDYSTKNNPNKSEILSTVMMRFTWIDVATGEKDENLFGANGQNDWDKGVGSALTYGERYFLLKFFHISTDEDDVDNPNRKEPEVPRLMTEAQKNRLISLSSKTTIFSPDGIKKILELSSSKTLTESEAEKAIITYEEFVQSKTKK